MGILVDYESPLARRVAGDIWSGLSRAALEGGHVRITAFWESLRETKRIPKHPRIHVFAVGQDRPDAVDAIEAVGDPRGPRLYGVVVNMVAKRSTGSYYYYYYEETAPVPRRKASKDDSKAKK